MTLQIDTDAGSADLPAPEKVMHVIFTPEGIPGHISDDPRPGSEPVAGLDLAFLIAHRRTETGEWVVRDLPKPPSPEELAAREAARRAAEAEADAQRLEAAIDAEIQASQPWRDFQRGKMTLTAYREAAQSIEDQVRAGWQGGAAG